MKISRLAFSSRHYSSLCQQQLQAAVYEPSQYSSAYACCVRQKTLMQLQGALMPEYIELLEARSLQEGQKNAAWIRARR